MRDKLLNKFLTRSRWSFFRWTAYSIFLNGEVKALNPQGLKIYIPLSMIHLVHAHQNSRLLDWIF